MLRLIVLLLLLANAAYFAWSQGLLAPWGIAPAQQSEPQRLEQQIKPQALRILAPDEARRLERDGHRATRRPSACKPGRSTTASGRPQAGPGALAGRLLDAGAGGRAGALDRLHGQVPHRRQRQPQEGRAAADRRLVRAPVRPGAGARPVAGRLRQRGRSGPPARMRWRSAACAPPRWCRSGPKCAARCSSCRPWTTPCVRAWMN